MMYLLYAMNAVSGNDSMYVDFNGGCDSHIKLLS